MGKGGGKRQTQRQSSTSSVEFDPATQEFIDRQRELALTGAGAVTGSQPWTTGPLTQTPGEMAQPFMNPYLDQVIGGVRGEFDHLRGLASRDVHSAATQAGAYGGSRAALMEGARLGELDRAQVSQVGSLLHNGYNTAMDRGLSFAEHQRQLQERQLQEPYNKYAAGLGLMNLGMGPVATTQRSYGDVTSRGGGGSTLGSAASGAMAGSTFGPWGAAAGGALGLLGGLFG